MKRPGLTLVVLPAMLFLLTALRGAESKSVEPAAAPSATVQRATETPAPLGQMTAEQILKHFDKNGDGKLDEDEAADAHEAMLKDQMDRQAARKDVANAPAERQRLLEMFDKNHDGRLDDEERAEMQKSLANRRAGGGGGGPGFAMRQEILRRFDKNHDGKIDDTEWAEVSPMLHERLDGMLRQVRRFDKNNDGTIDDDEWATATDEIRKWLNEGPPAGTPPKTVPAAAKATEKAPAAASK